MLEDLVTTMGGWWQGIATLKVQVPGIQGVGHNTVSKIFRLKILLSELKAKCTVTLKQVLPLTVKIPLKCSSSSTTRTQSLRFAAISCAASMTNMFSLTVRACAGLRAETVPAIFLPDCLTLALPPLFLESSCSSFLRMA